MSLFPSLRTPPPDVAVEIDRSHVGAARLERRGGQTVVAAHAVEPLDPGIVTPSMTALNLADVGAVGRAVGDVLKQVGGRSSRVALVIPDTVAKVSLVRLEKVPSRREDLREIVRWQMRKSAPFPVEQAVLSVSPGTPGPDGSHEFVVVLAREDVVRQYEQACAMAGAHAGLVDLATFSVINSVIAGGGAPGGDWLLVNVTDTYITLAILRGQALGFFRHRSEESEGTLADLTHQTAMYYEDRLQGSGIVRVWLSGSAAVTGADAVRRDLEGRLGAGVEIVDPRAAAALTDRIATTPELADTLSPLVGVLSHAGTAA